MFLSTLALLHLQVHFIIHLHVLKLDGPGHESVMKLGNTIYYLDICHTKVYFFSVVLVTLEAMLLYKVLK